MKQNSLTSILALVATGRCAVPYGSAPAPVAGRHEGAATSVEKPAMIYVADFELDTANIKADAGPLPPPPKMPGPFGRILPPPPGTPKDP